MQRASVFTVIHLVPPFNESGRCSTCESSVMKARTHFPSFYKGGQEDCLDLAPDFRTLRKDIILCQEVSRCQEQRDDDLMHSLSSMLCG
jgi:hypothetical protein